MGVAPWDRLKIPEVIVVVDVIVVIIVESWWSPQWWSKGILVTIWRGHDGQLWAGDSWSLGVGVVKSVIHDWHLLILEIVRIKEWWSLTWHIAALQKRRTY